MSPTLEMTGFLPKLANFMLERKQDASGGGGYRVPSILNKTLEFS